MPNTSSAKKALRQNTKRRLQNRSQRSALRTVVKKARSAAAEGAEDAVEALRQATKKLDQAAAKHLIHKNTAARTKSRLAKLHAKSTAKPAQG
ncbi:MAG: 30S ribosomal protein S20 [Planctomyces sp.]|nr:30S ribosomal protein S20 [Planctomyces sp.]